MAKNAGRAVPQGNILQRPITEEQRRLALRFDALRAALGKQGTFYGDRMAYIFPIPELAVRKQPKKSILTFAGPIKGAATVTLVAADWTELETCTFDLMIKVEDPGPAATVEVCDRNGRVLAVATPIRVP
jgi:hypothetical protein